MTDFSNIDPNFRVEPAPDADGLVYRAAPDPLFSLRGVTFEQGCYRRRKSICKGNFNFLSNFSLFLWLSLCYTNEIPPERST